MLLVTRPSSIGGGAGDGWQFARRSRRLVGDSNACGDWPISNSSLTCLTPLGAPRDLQRAFVRRGCFDEALERDDPVAGLDVDVARLDLLVGEVLRLNPRGQPAIGKGVAGSRGGGLHLSGGSLRLLLGLGAVASNRDRQRERHRDMNQLSCPHSFISLDSQDVQKERLMPQSRWVLPNWDRI